MEISDDYHIYQRRKIMHTARRSKSMEELKKNLAKRGIKMQYRNNVMKTTTFTAKNFKIDSTKGNDRVFTDTARRTVEKSNPKIVSMKMDDKMKNYAKFDRMRAERLKQPPQQKKGLSR